MIFCGHKPPFLYVSVQTPYLFTSVHPPIAMKKDVGAAGEQSMVGEKRERVADDEFESLKRQKPANGEQRRSKEKEAKGAAARAAVVKGVCVACKKKVTSKQHRTLVHGAYYHVKCAANATTPYRCQFCNGVTNYKDILLYHDPAYLDKSLAQKKYLSPIGCAHLQCWRHNMKIHRDRIKRLNNYLRKFTK